MQLLRQSKNTFEVIFETLKPAKTHFSNFETIDITKILCI